MPTFRAKPVEVMARQVPSSDQPLDFLPIATWSGGAVATTNMVNPRINLKTQHGYVEAWPGDWVVRDAPGSFRVCSPDTFELIYEPLDD